MENTRITREMVYLCIGEDMARLDSTELHYTLFRGVKYFLVGSEKVICRDDKLLFCSCNERYCWHIFKVVLDRNDAKLAEI